MMRGHNATDYILQSKFPAHMPYMTYHESPVTITVEQNTLCKYDRWHGFTVRCYVYCYFVFDDLFSSAASTMWQSTFMGVGDETFRWRIQDGATMENEHDQWPYTLDVICSASWSTYFQTILMDSQLEEPCRFERTLCSRTLWVKRWARRPIGLAGQQGRIQGAKGPWPPPQKTCLGAKGAMAPQPPWSQYLFTALIKSQVRCNLTQYSAVH